MKTINIFSTIFLFSTIFSQTSGLLLPGKNNLEITFQTKEKEQVLLVEENKQLTHTCQYSYCWVDPEPCRAPFYSCGYEHCGTPLGWVRSICCTTPECK